MDVQFPLHDFWLDLFMVSSLSVPVSFPLNRIGTMFYFLWTKALINLVTLLTIWGFTRNRSHGVYSILLSYSLCASSVAAFPSQCSRPAALFVLYSFLRTLVWSPPFSVCLIKSSIMLHYLLLCNGSPQNLVAEDAAIIFLVSQTVLVIDPA